MDAATILLDLVRERDCREYNKRTGTAEYPPHTVIIRFVPRVDGQHAAYSPKIPAIDIYRAECAPGWEDRSAYEDATNSPDALDELISLAHELGHHDRATEKGRDLFDNMNPEKRYEEEVRAWARGRQILANTPFSGWSSFDERKRGDLATYRVGLTVEAAREIEERLRDEMC
jgi:hypothetical protein